MFCPLDILSIVFSISQLQKLSAHQNCPLVNQQHKTEPHARGDAGGDFFLLPQNVGIGSASAFSASLLLSITLCAFCCRKGARPKTVGFGRFWFCKARRIWREVWQYLCELSPDFPCISGCKNKIKPVYHKISRYNSFIQDDNRYGNLNTALKCKIVLRQFVYSASSCRLIVLHKN